MERTHISNLMSSCEVCNKSAQPHVVSSFISVGEANGFVRRLLIQRIFCF